jgi:hypothetical protein
LIGAGTPHEMEDLMEFKQMTKDEREMEKEIIHDELEIAKLQYGVTFIRYMCTFQICALTRTHSSMWPSTQARGHPLKHVATHSSTWPRTPTNTHRLKHIPTNAHVHRRRSHAVETWLGWLGWG